MTEKASRKEQILQALAAMLEATPGARITTKKLAVEVGVSEAALYRHFPSKTRMFEGLIGFADESLLTRIRQIRAEDTVVLQQLGRILTLLLVFAERNPGIARLLTGDVLAGEDRRLHQQVEQLFSRLEAQLKQLLREAEFKQGLRTPIGAAAMANLLLAVVSGRIMQFVRSGFRDVPSLHWQEQWHFLSAQVLVS